MCFGHESNVLPVDCQNCGLATSGVDGSGGRGVGGGCGGGGGVTVGWGGGSASTE